MLRLTLLLALLSLITACSLGSGVAPQDHFYRLPELKLKTEGSSSTQLFKEIVIKPVKSTGLYHERAILFIENDRPLELQRYHYSFWASTPSNLVHNALLQGVQSSGIATQVSQVLSVTRPDLIISSRIVNFERNLGKDQVSVLVALDVTVRRGENNTLVWNRRYSSTDFLTSTDMHASANAFGKVLKTITIQLVNDLKKAR